MSLADHASAKQRVFHSVHRTCTYTKAHNKVSCRDHSFSQTSMYDGLQYGLGSRSGLDEIERIRIRRRVRIKLRMRIRKRMSIRIKIM